MEKIIKVVLIVLVVGIFGFVGTYGAFTYLKERWCAQDLNSAACYQTYPQFMRGLI